MIKKFISDVSGDEFPIHQKVSGASVRKEILTFIDAAKRLQREEED